PVGVDSQWRRIYGKKCGDDVDCLRNAYAGDLRRFLQESVAGATVSFEWHEIAFRHILAVDVRPAATVAYLIASGDILRRVGATNRKVRQIDALIERIEPDGKFSAP